MEALVGPARQRLIQALCAAPDGGVHLRRLARAAGLSLASLQRELKRLKLLGVLQRTTDANRVLLALDHGSPQVRLLAAMQAALSLQGIRFTTSPGDRVTEEGMVALCAHMPPDATLWRSFGEPGFLAGLATMLAGHSGFDRPAYLALAESLSPGASGVERHAAWFETHRPDFARLLAMIDRERRTHARAQDQ